MSPHVHTFCHRSLIFQSISKTVVYNWISIKSRQNRLHIFTNVGENKFNSLRVSFSLHCHPYKSEIKQRAVRLNKLIYLSNEETSVLPPKSWYMHTKIKNICKWGSLINRSAQSSQAQSLNYEYLFALFELQSELKMIW